MPVRTTTGADEELQIPPMGTSPITGVPNVANWGGLNKFNTASRWVIGDSEADELINWLPQLQAFQQVPGPGAALTTLPSAIVWAYSDVLNGNLFTYCLCTSGALIQVSTTGVQTSVGTGFGTAANTVDICNWQGTNMLICDNSQSKIFNWNGTTLATVFSAQPGNFVAVFSGRLWIANGLTLTWTNAGTFNSFGGDSGSFAIGDSGCGNPIIGLLNANGSLYVFGSNWIKTINNLTDVGNPLLLTFQQPTISTQVSIITKWGLVVWGSIICFPNNSGIWSLNGTTIAKMSTALDGFFQNLGTSSFSGAYGRILGKECVFWQALWNGDGNNTVFGITSDGIWFRVIPVSGTSTGSVSWVTGQVSSTVTNNVPIVYMIDPVGKLYNLFGAPAATVTSTFNTKIWDFFSKLAFDWFTDIAIQYVITGASTLVVSEVGDSGIIQGPATPAGPVTFSHNPNLGMWQNALNVVGQWQNNTPTSGNWQGTVTFQFVFDQAVVPFQDRGFGLNMTFTGTAIVLHALVATYRKQAAGKG